MTRPLALTAAVLVVGAESALAAGAVSWSLRGPVVATTVACAVAVTVALASLFAVRSLGASPHATLTRLTAVATTLAVVTAIAAVGLWLIGARRPSPPRHVLLAAFILGAVCPGAARVVHTRVTNGVAQLFPPEDLDVSKALASWSGGLSRAVPIDELFLQLAELLKPSLKLAAIEVWLATEDNLQMALSLPERPKREVKLTTGNMDALARHTVTGRGWAGVWAPDLLAGREEVVLRIAPASFTGTLCGVLVAERHPPGPPLSEEDDALLADAARRLAVLLHSARLDRALQASDVALRAHAAELAASRARLASTADDARHRIERDLHDGAQQHLLAIATKLELARHLRNGDSASLANLLDEVHGDAASALEALRHLAHGVYPPSLEQHGLVAALRTAAPHVGVGVEVVAEVTARYPRPVETAVYFCCLEALQNVRKHANATRVVVRLSGGRDRLILDVIDDGSGFVAAADAAGRGVVNMRDRMGAVGGTVEIRSAPGAGTRVRLTVPLS